MKYNFGPSSPEQMNQDDSIYFFYQISFFPNNNRHHIRKFIINPDNTIKGYYNYYLTKGQIDKLLSLKSSNEYKLYSVSSLEGYSIPTSDDIYMAKSELFF